MVELPDDAASLLVQHALNSPYVDDDEMGPCCSTCCGPCYALAVLDTAGLLDSTLAAPRPHNLVGYDWWDGEQVDRAWLATRMAPSCDLCLPDNAPRTSP